MRQFESAIPDQIEYDVESSGDGNVPPAKLRCSIIFSLSSSLERQPIQRVEVDRFNSISGSHI